MYGDYSIRAFNIRAPGHQILLFSFMVLQNYPVFKYSRVTRKEEIKLTKIIKQRFVNLRTEEMEISKTPPRSDYAICVCNPGTNEIRHKILQTILNEGVTQYRYFRMETIVYTSISPLSNH